MYIMNDYLMATSYKHKYIAIVANYYILNTLQAGTTSTNANTSSVNGLLIMFFSYVTKH